MDISKDQIREIVKVTLDELIERKMLSIEDYHTKVRAVEVCLYNFFDNKDNSASYPLNALSDDPYIDIIFLYYRDRVSIESIAEYMDRDTSTIKRNKKRLILKMYELLN